jgi:hypothetical protein
MAKQTINIGTLANDGTGDPLRTAFTKINENFTELYTNVENIPTDVSNLTDNEGLLGGAANLGSFKIEGNTLGTIGGEGSWGEYDINLSPNGESNAWIYIPKDTNSANGAPLVIGNWPTTSGGIQLSVNNKSWTFRPDGTLSAPTISVDLHNGGSQNGQVLQFSQNQQVIITGPTPAENENAQRLIIQGQKATGTGEGGDVYLWAGDSDANGGDIKIYAGDADASPGNGGYINIDAGNGYANGGDVTITAGSSAQNGGDVRITAGTASQGASGRVEISSVGGSWIFGADGDLTLPSGGTISDTETTTVIAPPTASAGQSLVIRPTSSLWSVTSSGNIVYGSPITISVNLLNWAYFGTVNYEITGTGVTEESLGRPLTGNVVFTGIFEPDTQTVTWTIPANSNITEFTFTLTTVDGTRSNDINTENDPALYYNFEYNAMPTGYSVTVTNNGTSNSEANHIHLVTGNPATVDLYLGDDDQYVKIEKNAGNVVIGTNVNTKQWTFGTDGKLTLPGAIINSAVNITGSGDPAYPTALDLTKTVNKLSDNTGSNYTLADGVEGQIMYLVPKDGATNAGVYIMVNHGRVLNNSGATTATIFTDIAFNPFGTDTSMTSNVVTMMFTDGAWQSSGGVWD